MRSILPRFFSREHKNGGGGGGGNRTHLYLNVYDLTPINNYLYWFGLGIFHSGIEDPGGWSEVAELKPEDQAYFLELAEQQ